MYFGPNIFLTQKKLVTIQLFVQTTQTDIKDYINVFLLMESIFEIAFGKDENFDIENCIL